MNKPLVPLQIGVTGGIGAGKSVVCRIFGCLGVPVYEADVRAKWLPDHNPNIRREVIALLGEEAFAGGTYNRKYVASQVFSNPDLLQKLNHIIHPRVSADSDAWLLRQAGHPYVIREAALMNKAGDGNNLDFILVVTAPLPVRIERIKSRDPQRPEAEIQAIIERQTTEEARLKLADFVIDNDLNSALVPQVIDLHNVFVEKWQDSLSS